MKEVEGFSVQLVLSHRATAAKASSGKFGFLVLAVAAFLSTFVLLFILHPTVSSAFLPLAVPHPAAPSFLTCSLLCYSQSHRLCKSPRAMIATCFLQTLSLYYSLASVSW